MCRKKSNLMLGHVEDPAPVFRRPTLSSLQASLRAFHIDARSNGRGPCLFGTRATGIAEMIEHGDDGFLMDSTAAGVKRDCNRAMLTDAPGMREMGLAARKK